MAEYNQQSGGNSGHQGEHLVVHTGKPHRLQVKVQIPVKQHPNFNFVGKLLGPKGSSLKQVQEVTQTRMAILGKGSMRDKKKEEELRAKGEPKYAHLNDELHVEISAYAPPSEAYRRVAHALDEVARYLVPDFGDEMHPYAEMPMNGRPPKPGYGYEDPGMRPPPPGQAPPVRGGSGYWASTPPVRGGPAPRRVLQPRPGAPSAPRRPAPPPPAGAGDYSYDDPYGGYGGGSGRTGDYYNDQSMEEPDVSFGGDEYGAEAPRGGSGPTRSSFPRGRSHPYASSTRPY